MNSTLYLSISALVYTLIIAVLFFNKKKIDTPENRIFKKLVIITIVSLITELLILFVMNNITVLIPYILKAFNICIFSWVSIFGLYAFVVSHKEQNIDYKEKYKVIYSLYKVFYLLVISVIIVLPVYLYDKSMDAYSYGPSVNMVYMMCGLLILICMFVNDVIPKSNKK